MNPILKRTITGLSVAAVVVAAILWLPPAAIVGALGLLALAACVEYAQLLAKKRPLASPSGLFLLAVGSVLVAGLFAVLAAALLTGGPLRLFYLVAVVKISDMGGFAFGVTAAHVLKGGTHKLCPSVSPNKSWEGLFGSLFGSCLVSCAFLPVLGGGWGRALAFGVIAALAGTAGDLVESRFKRWVGVKDSATMSFTNGMGGLLDMFDSLLFAPAVLLALLAFA